MSTTRPKVTGDTSAPVTVEGWVGLPDKQMTNAATAGNGDAALNAAASVQARHLVIRASAGSGKTYQLALRVLRLVLDGVPVDRILASTFTRKAAGEILGRILLRLSVASHDGENRCRLARELGVDSLDPPMCLRVLADLARSLHRLRVGTLDSFFSRLATNYTLELGLPPGWEIIDELADWKLQRQAIESILWQEKRQWTRRLTNLLSRGDAGRSVSGLIQRTVESFYGVFRQTEEAAWRRFPDVMPLSTEALAEAIEELRTVGLPEHKNVQKQRHKDVEAAARGDWKTFMGTGIGATLKKGQATYYGAAVPAAAQAVYEKLLGHARAIEIAKLAEQTAATHELLTAFDTEYRRLKQETRGLRFEDVTERLADVIGGAGRPDEALRSVAFRLDAEISHLLLDEFQDTSLAQWQVMRPFADRITQARGGTSYFCVGDVKQAIYGWRGGVAEIFDAIDDQLHGLESKSLAESFRSSQVVIDAVNALFHNMPRHSDLKPVVRDVVRRWCAAVEAHTTSRDIPGHMTLETGPGAVDGLPGNIISTTVDRIQQVTQSAPGASVGVLVRKNKVIPQLIAELRRRNIEASEESGNPVTDAAAVAVILSLVRLADHAGDTVARFHVATSPLGPAMDFTRFDDDPLAARLSAAVRRALVDDGYGPTVDCWARQLAGCCTERDVTRLGQLVEMAYRFGEQSTLRPMDFVHFVEGEKVDDPQHARVRVMSIHQAKGLQFDAVVLPLVDRTLIAVTPDYVTRRPSHSSRPDLVSIYRGEEIQRCLPDEFQEAFAQTHAAAILGELCTLYVAVTRAVHALHIIVPASAGSEGKLPTSAAGLVRAAFTDGGKVPPQSILHEQGTANWGARAVTTHEQPESTGATGAEDIPAEKLTVRLAEMTDGRNRGLQRVAPSQQEAERVRLSQLVKAPQSMALDRGTLIHAWFEQIEWLDDGLPNEERLTMIARRMGFAATEIDRHLTEFRDMLKRPAVAELLARHAYETYRQPPLPPPILDELQTPFSLDVERERRVACRLEGNLLTGTIDRLVLLRRDWQVFAADIIDFKTDAVGTGGTSQFDRTAHYRRQLESYAAAIACIYCLPAERITARLVFVESGDVITV